MDGFLTDERRSDGRRRYDDGIDTCIFQRQTELLDEFFAECESGEISCRGNLCSHFEAGANVVAVIGGSRREPASLLVVVSGLGPGDLVSGVFRFV